jgi:hypothetical protein
MPEPIMTSEEYVKQEGHSCPMCGESDLDYGSLDYEGYGISQHVWCQRCPAIWWENYRLYEYQDLTMRTPEEMPNA